MLKQICVSVLLGCLSFNGLGYNGPAEDPVPPKPCNECPSDANANNECVSYKFEFGSAAHEPDFPVGVFSIYGRRPSETMFTPLGLYYYHPLFTRLAGVSEENGKQIVKLQGPNREIEIYEFAANSSIGYPGGVFRNKLKKVLVMLDADHEPTTISPAYYKLVDENANYVLYSVEEQKAVSYTTSTGRVLTADSKDVRLETILDAEGAIMQVYSGVDGLADVVVTAEELGYIRTYEIRLYHPSQVGAKVNNKYTVSGQPYMTYQVINPNHPQEQTITENGETHIQIVPPEIREIQFIKVANGSNRIASYTYSDAVDDWTLTQDGGNVIVSRAKTAQTRATGAAQGLVIERKNGTGKVAYKESQTLQKFDFGDLPTQITRGTNDTTTYTYYEDINQPGSYGKKKTVQFSDGYWEKYYYDDQRRLNMIVSPFKNQTITVSESEAKVEIISFSSVDSRDIPFAGDPRPRMKETKINNITVAKEYFAYFSDTNGDYVEIHEVCQGAAAEYGNLANARTEKRYYGDKNDSTTLGRLKSVVFSNGLMDSYVYAYGNFTQSSSPGNSSFAVNVNGYALKTTITHGTADSPTGIANKTTQTEKIGDAFGNPVMEKEYVCTRAAAAATDATPAVTASYEQLSWKNATFNATHQQLNTYNSRNEETNTTWDCCNKASYTDEVGIQYTYTYDSMNRLISETKKGYNGSSDVVTSYTYDANNKLLNKTVTAGSLSLQESFVYDQAGRIIQSTDSKGLVTAIQFSNKVITTTKPGNCTEIITSYNDRSLASITGTSVMNRFFDYGVMSNGQLWRKENIGSANSLRWQKSYTDLANRITKNENSGYGNSIIESISAYNTKGFLIKKVETGKPAISISYDEIGNIETVGYDIDDDGSLEIVSKDRIIKFATGYSKESGAWYLSQTKSTYGTDNNSLETIILQQKQKLSGLSSNIISEVKNIDIYGNITTTTIQNTRSARKRLVSTVSPSSSVSQQKTFINGLLSSERSFSNITIAYSYDALERMSSINNPRTGVKAITYYASGAGKLGQVMTAPDQIGNIITYDYYSDTGWLKSMTDALNNVSYYSYNSLGKVIRQWGRSVYPVEFSYNAFGEQIQMKTYRTGANWNAASWPGSSITADTTQWNYDPASSLLVSKTDAADNSVAYTYSSDGKVLTRTWARKVNDAPLVTTYSYDNFGQLTSIDYSDNTQSIQYSYNRIGLPVAITDALGTRTFTYNSQFSLISETTQGLYNKAITRNYASSGVKGRFLGIDIDGDSSYTYAYDQYGRFNRVTVPTGNFNYTYLANSDLVSSVSRPNNVTTSFSYESTRNLITKVANGTLSTFNYTNDAVGRRSSVNRSGSAFPAPDTLSYTYDSISELLTAVSNNNSSYNYSYTYDPIGNRKTASLSGAGNVYTANSLNQYTSVTSGGVATTPTYDADGNTLTLDGWALTWNAENRLIKAVKNTIKLEFLYDYMGRRIEKKVFNNNVLTQNTHFVYDGYKLVEEINALDNNAVLRSYVWQPFENNDIPLAVTTGSDTCYYLTDANKNVSELTNASGASVAHYEYSPYGKVLVSTGTYATENPLRFSSEYNDLETGFIYYNYRYYDSKFGRWLSRDPIEEKGGINLYSFLTNNPVNQWDHLGCFNNDMPFNFLTPVGRIQIGYAEAATRINKEHFIPFGVFSGDITYTFFFIDHTFSINTKGCKQYCISLSSSLVGISVGIATSPSPETPFTINVGPIREYSLGVSVTPEGAIGGRLGFGISFPYVNGSARLYCFNLNENDIYGCPCPPPNDGKSTIYGFFTN